MHRSHIALRVLVAIGVTVAAVLWLPAASSHHQVTFTECTADEGEEEGDPEPPPEPTLTPTPTTEPTSTPTPSAEFPDNCTPPEESIIRGERSLRFEVASGSLRPIRDVRAFLDSEDEDIESPGGVLIECSPPDQAPAEAGCQYPDGEPEGVFTFPWDSNVVTPHNGAYTFRGWAFSEPHAPNPESEDDPRVAEARRHRLLVDNPPVDLGAPSIIVATENSITLEWDPAPEPDLLSYTVYRAVTPNSDTKPKTSDFKAVASTTKAALRDEIDEPAAYWYRVRSTRRSVVTPDVGISSAVSPMSGPGVVGGLRATPPPEGEEAPVEAAPRRPVVVPRSPGRPPPVPDAPFSAYLPFEATDLPESDDSDTVEEVEEPGHEDPRAPFLPMAVGAFLVSSALAVGRMPF